MVLVMLALLALSTLAMVACQIEDLAEDAAVGPEPLTTPLAPGGL